ncbi:hypothetical protein C8R42DRAFT_287102 [Lentinula raphanica]|nr:hypothetical protein C8R42DRAFT_287102 [Lentinula raphanica]
MTVWSLPQLYLPTMCPNSHVYLAALTTPTNPKPELEGPVPDCVPEDPISHAAYALASQHLHPAILNHSLRVWIYARAYAEHEHEHEYEGSSRPTLPFPLLFTACILHDLGTTPAFSHIDSEPDELQRFEIEGADAAASLLREIRSRASGGDGDSSNPEQELSISNEDIDHVWRAIALHTTPQIAERMGGMVRVVRLAVLSDFNRGSIAGKKGLQRETEAEFERMDIERVLVDAVVQQALSSRMPEGKAPPASWPHDLLRAHRRDPRWEGVNKGF